MYSFKNSVGIKNCLTLCILMAMAVSVVWNPAFAQQNPSYSENIITWDQPFFPNGIYNENIPKPEEVIGFPLGKKPIRYSDMVKYMEALSEESPIVLLKEHGVTHEGRKLYHFIISSSENIERLEEIRASIGKIADPRTLDSKQDAGKIINNTPAVAWMSYAIHGDEFSGTDAALQLAYQLAAGTDDLSRRIKNNVVVLIDPIENPDGRERYHGMLEIYGSKTPNYDQHSLQHNGVWPRGRTNHYLFDLNRDYILLTQPETRGRVATILKWNPQLVVDAHEMWSDATYLFSPPRQPINYNTPENVMKWYPRFHDDHAEAFDRYGWSYYSGDWNEQWYPGYGSAWPTYLGAVGILYEQAGVDGEIVLQKDGHVMNYHEAVHQQFISSMANLTTLADNRKEILGDYFISRKTIIAKGKKDVHTFLFVPDKDTERMNRFIETLLLQGIEVHKTTEDFKVSKLKGVYGARKGVSFRKGTYIVSTEQPLGALAKAILEFDPRLNMEFLEEERRELEKNNESRMYETSAWSLPIAFGIEAYQANKSVKVTTVPVNSIEEPEGFLDNDNPRYGYLINNTGEKTSRVLIELFKKEVVIFTAKKPFETDGISFERGTLLLRHDNNTKDLSGILKAIADEFHVDIHGVNSAATAVGPDLGSTQFSLLKEPHVAVLTSNPIEWGSVGTLWHLIDVELGLPHSLLEFVSLPRTDISRYNVIVMPSVWGGPGTAQGVLGKGGIAKLKTWMQAGGTLICTGNSAVFAADSSSHLSKARLLRQSFDKIPLYDKMTEFEQRAENPQVDTLALWHPEKVEKKSDEEPPPGPANTKYSEKLDAWKRRFQPRGVFLKVNIDKEHWLAYGMDKQVPAVVYNDYALLATSPVSTVGRFADENSLRLSGLLWPEARERYAKTAYLTRESVGKGQLVLFLMTPYMRAYTHGTRQLFVNALLYGPGLGTGRRHGLK